MNKLLKVGVSENTMHSVFSREQCMSALGVRSDRVADGQTGRLRVGVGFEVFFMEFLDCFIFMILECFYSYVILLCVDVSQVGLRCVFLWIPTVTPATRRRSNQR